MEGEAGLGQHFGIVMFRGTSEEWRGTASRQEEKRERVGPQKPRERCLPKDSATSYATGHVEGGPRLLICYHDKGRFDGGAGTEA